MIENFLRPPQTLPEVAAEVLRILGALSVVIAAVLFALTDAGIVAFMLPGLVAPRFIGLRAGADSVLTGTLLVAAWSNVVDLYTTISWWDLLSHLIGGGVLAAGLYLLFAHLRFVAAPGAPEFTSTAALVLTTMLGLGLSAIWEMVEWFGYTYVTDEIHITYADTISDMAAGGLGALCGGFAVAFLRLMRPAAHMSPALSCHDRELG